MLRQRVLGLCAGYEDLNDFEVLRKDPLMQTASGVTEALAGSSTLCRFENGQDRQLAWKINELLVETFIQSKLAGAPKTHRGRLGVQILKIVREAIKASEPTRPAGVKKLEAKVGTSQTGQLPVGRTLEAFRKNEPDIKEKIP